MKFNRKIQKISLYAVLTVIVIFGLVSTSLLITTNITEHYFETITFISHYLPSSSSEPVNHSQIILVGNRWLPGFSWIFDQIFNNNLQYEMHYKLEPVKNKKVFLVVDRDFLDYLSNNEAEKNHTAAWSLYDQSHFLMKVIDKTPAYPRDTFPYTSMALNNRLQSVELRSNY